MEEHVHITVGVLVLECIYELVSMIKVDVSRQLLNEVITGRVIICRKKLRRHVISMVVIHLLLIDLIDLIIKH